MTSICARPVTVPEPAAGVDPTTPVSFDPGSVDLDAFTTALDELRRETVDGLSEADFTHLQKTERWGRSCTLAGYATAWIFPNPLSAALIAVGMTVRFVVMHFVGHGAGYRVSGGEVLDSYGWSGWRNRSDRLLTALFPVE